MNAGYLYREQVGADAAGHTLVAYLSERYRHSSCDTWHARIAGGEVSVEGRPAEAAEILRAGTWVAWQRPAWNEPDVPLAFAVLHRDADLLAVAKPRGLPALPGGGFLTHTLLHLVRARHPEATPMHRLDRGTSGLMLFARSAQARSRLAAAWRAGDVEKTYRALVSGVPRTDAFSIDAPIGPVAHPRLERVYAVSPSGKAAFTHVRVLERRGERALVEVALATGRPHQIRIHLAAAGHPLAGDPLYAAGGLPRDEPGLPGDAGYLLHAHRLRLAHPQSGAPLELLCAPPDALR